MYVYILGGPERGKKVKAEGNLWQMITFRVAKENTVNDLIDSSSNLRHNQAVFLGNCASGKEDVGIEG